MRFRAVGRRRPPGGGKLAAHVRARNLSDARLHGRPGSTARSDRRSRPGDVQETAPSSFRQRAAPSRVESFREATVSLRGTCREVGDIALVDFSGKITLGEGSATLRTMVRELIGAGPRKILLNLGGVDYIESHGNGAR